MTFATSSTNVWNVTFVVSTWERSPNPVSVGVYTSKPASRSVPRDLLPAPSPVPAAVHEHERR